MMKGNTLLLAGLSVATVAIVALPAHASVSCDTSNLTGATECLGAITGNDSNSDLSGSFGIDDWTEFSKLDSGSGDNGIINVTGGSTSGDYSLSGLDNNSNYMVALKGGPSYSLYNLGSGFESTSGTWDTSGIQTGGGKASPGLSHFTIYESGNSQAVPEPTTILGLALAGGLGGFLKKKASKK